MPGLSGPPGAVTAAPATPPTTAPTGPPTAAPATTPVAVPALCCGVWQAAAPRQIRAVKMSLRMGISFAADRSAPRANGLARDRFSFALEASGNTSPHYAVGFGS